VHTQEQLVLLVFPHLRGVPADADPNMPVAHRTTFNLTSMCRRCPDTPDSQGILPCQFDETSIDQSQGYFPIGNPRDGNSHCTYQQEFQVCERKFGTCFKTVTSIYEKVRSRTHVYMHIQVHIHSVNTQRSWLCVNVLPQIHIDSYMHTFTHRFVHACIRACMHAYACNTRTHRGNWHGGRYSKAVDVVHSRHQANVEPIPRVIRCAQLGSALYICLMSRLANLPLAPACTSANIPQRPMHVRMPGYHSWHTAGSVLV
jgi:hypothetical protein